MYAVSQFLLVEWNVLDWCTPYDRNDGIYFNTTSQIRQTQCLVTFLKIRRSFKPSSGWEFAVD